MTILSKFLHLLYPLHAGGIVRTISQLLSEFFLRFSVAVFHALDSILKWMLHSLRLSMRDLYSFCLGRYLLYLREINEKGSRTEDCRICGEHTILRGLDRNESPKKFDGHAYLDPTFCCNKLHNQHNFCSQSKASNNRFYEPFQRMQLKEALEFSFSIPVRTFTLRADTRNDRFSWKPDVSTSKAFPRWKVSTFNIDFGFHCGNPTIIGLIIKA